ncbi:MAG: type III pantothenate kinase [Clostridiales bacterium]|nr:type III pantothenate kinase [Clostridiales bacterium]
MILTLDIGNTNIKTALFEGERMAAYWRISTNRTMTSDEYGMLMCNLFTHHNVSMKSVTGIVISSVVPTINYTIEHMCMSYFGRAPMFVAPGIKTGIHIRYDNPKELGSDRIANAVAAYELYGGPCIYIDFGTATSFGVVSQKGEFLGGAICPGLKVTADALVDRTAKLPRFELVKPATVIGKNTITNLQSGILYGHIGLVKYLIKRMKEELGSDCKVIATGGMAVLIREECPEITDLDGLLTLKGLRLIYDKNA